MGIVFAAWLLSVAPQPPEKADAETITRSLVETTRTLVEALGEVSDEKSAERLKPRLNELEARFDKLRRQFADRPERERIAAEVRWNDRRKEQEKALLLAHDRVFSKHKPAYRTLSSTALFLRIEKELDDRVTQQARMLEAACNAYFIRSNEWPTALPDLVKPPDGGRPFVEGGEKAVVDPWGAPFRYGVKADESGLERPYVWTISPYGDGKRVLGKAPPANR
jgi:hypothetical protein